jgi:hypothetical protein
MPSAYQLQRSAVSARQVSASVKAAHGSVLGGGEGGTGQSQGAHAVFGGHVGHVHAGDEVAPLLELPLLAVPIPVLPAPTAPVPHAQSHGGQVVPGAQGGQAQVQVA